MSVEDALRKRFSNFIEPCEGSGVDHDCTYEYVHVPVELLVVWIEQTYWREEA